MGEPPLLAFYGDDFTGSSAVMEVLSFSGVPTMLFLAPPDAQMLARYPDLSVVGIAGLSRSKSPAWMDENLPSVFDALKETGARITHYKVCSTFDSSPETGSIGKAIDIGAPRLGGAWTPLVVGAPALRRYQIFGELYAGLGETIHRLDRHPVMSHHPVTPMAEANLGRHLHYQTARQTGLVSFIEIKAGEADAAVARARSGGAQIIALDVIDEEGLAEVGRLVANEGAERVFAVGSQGVEYALVAYWRATGRLPQSFKAPRLMPSGRLFCVSGSCSQVTAGQLDVAEQAGFAVLDLDVLACVDERAFASALDEVGRQALELMAAGRDVIVATSRLPESGEIARLAAVAAAAGISLEEANRRIGAGLGALILRMRRHLGVERVAIAGGDTSGHATTALGVEALSALAPLAPGAPLCKAHSISGDIDGLEVTLKGGQMGAPDFFLTTRDGKD